MHSCNDACTPSDQGVRPDEAKTCTQGHTGVHMLICSYAKGVGQTGKDRWTCIHVLMHVHLLTKVWDQM